MTLMSISLFAGNGDKDKPSPNTAIQYNIDAKVNDSTLIVTISGNINDEISLSFMNVRGEESYHEDLKAIHGKFKKVFHLNKIQRGVYFFKVDAGDEIRLKKISL